ncbi:MAG: glycosyltransferase [Flavobacteriales bacterium]|nr:glycosyltransferase [Flavobacteriales bacterium]
MVDENPKHPTVLCIFMEFAPVNTTGAFRSIKFIKYLPQFGVKPVVVSIDEQEASVVFNAKIDTALNDEISPSVPVYRFKLDQWKPAKNKVIAFLKIFFSIKDRIAENWKHNFFRSVDSVIKKHKPDIIYTSVPPFSAGELAYQLSKKYNIPFVLDMRDLWAMLGTSPFPTYFHHSLTRKNEYKLFKHARFVTTVTPQVVDIFKSTHNLPESKFRLIQNGFDSSTEHLSPFEFSPFKDKIRIGYTGAFYYYPENNDDRNLAWWKRKGHRKLHYSPVDEDWKYRSPYYFLKCLSMLKNVSPEVYAKIEVEFIGNVPAWLPEMISEFDLTDKVIISGFLPKTEVLERQQNFDLVLATSEKIVGKEHYCLPSKLFDYPGLEKPIVGFVTEGIQKEFINKSGLGVTFDPDNLETSVNELLTFLSSTKKFIPDTEYLNTYSRLNLAAKLAELFKEI